VKCVAKGPLGIFESERSVKGDKLVDNFGIVLCNVLLGLTDVAKLSITYKPRLNTCIEFVLIENAQAPLRSDPDIKQQIIVA